MLLKAMLYSVLLGLLVAGISYWRLFTRWPEAWNFFSLAVALLIITPFFQASLASAWNNYSELHKQAWGNAVVLLLALVFTGLSFGMAHLLAELFKLVGVDLLRDLLRKDVVNWILAGVAFGGSMGVLREHDNIIDATLRLVQSVLSLLAAPLSIGLLVFIGTLPFTGLDSLWEATRNTSPIVFVCAAGAILLLNSVIRETDAGMNASNVIRQSARALAFCIAPLSAIAVVSIYTRVQQYGWTPDRLWASLICALLMFYGVFYLIAAFWGSKWSQRIRQLNLTLALFTAALALVLATPLLDFGLLSSKDQLQRFHSGQSSVDDFDAVALAFDFGPAGRRALESLDTSNNKALAIRVENALNSKNRWVARSNQNTGESQRQIEEKLQVRPNTAIINKELMEALQQHNICNGDYCFFLMEESGKAGSAISQNCQRKAEHCEVQVSRFKLCNDRWTKLRTGDCETYYANQTSEQKAQHKEQDKAAAAGDVEVREVVLKQVFIGGEAVGQAFK